jgi:hypothetical protein
MLPSPHHRLTAFFLSTGDHKGVWYMEAKLFVRERSVATAQVGGGDEALRRWAECAGRSGVR